MRIIIAGSRTFRNRRLVDETMEKYKAEVTAICCGGARGADALGREWALENGVEVLEFPAQWDLYGKAAGPLRNYEMAQAADFLVAFWDGKSRGTKNMIESMRRLGKHGEVIIYENNL